MKHLLLIILISFTIVCNGQKRVKIKGPNVIFEPNVNQKARTLKQGLNKNGDSLKFFSTKKPITQVDIFNKDFLESFDVNDNRTAIDLNALPAGNFIVQARVGKKRIIMYLKKTKGIDLASIRKMEELEEEDEEEEIAVVLKKKKKKKRKKAKYYWVVYESKSNIGSRKSMRLVYKNEVPELIEKNKYELESRVANDNILTIYAIYNKNKFMNKQFRNPKYYKSVKKSKLFNVVPFYNSSEAVVNETTP